MQNTMPIAPNDAFRTGPDNCLPVGTRLADFEISGIIGEGGFGIVYLAFDHSLQRTVAIKEYMPGALARRGTDNSITVRSQRDLETFETGLKSFINEARLLAQFDHPALIKVYRFWEENNTGYMAMRYYEGQTLKSVIRNDPALITEAWLKGMLKPILEALDALYRVRILHRDISPDNIMIQHSGEAVLLDFGAARQIIGDISQGLTIILKPGYAPIEQYANDAAMTQGPWTDIYSLSAVAYLAIVKKPPPTSVARIIKDPMEPLQNGEHPGFSKEFLSAIDKGLAVKPEDRPRSIEEFRELLRLELSLPVSTEPVSAASPTGIGRPNAGHGLPEPSMRKSLMKRWRPLWIAGVLCIVGAAGYFSLEQETAPAAAQVAASNPDGGAPERAALLRAMEEDAPPVVASTAGTRASKSSAAPSTGVVKLNIKPWGAVFVDGRSQGVSPPLKKMILSEGRHEIKVANPNFPSHTIEIDVTKKKTSNIEYDFSRRKK
jgi:serine/threonine protein kinase